MEYKSENILHITQEDIKAGPTKGRTFPECSVVIIHGQPGTLEQFKETDFFKAMAIQFGKSNPSIILTQQ